MYDFATITFLSFVWINEPDEWSLNDNTLVVKTDLNTDFWQNTWYNFTHNSGHMYGLEVNEDFTIQVCVEAEFATLYDQAGLMIYADEKHWLKAGIEYNDGQSTIGSVLTNDVSDWATGVFTGNPKKFWMKLTKVGNVVCVKYSPDGDTWHLLRLAPFFPATKYYVGPMCCTPKRKGMVAKFSELSIIKPTGDILHSN